MTLPPYPDAPRESTTETLHGQEVADPYRWLEDPASPRTTAWLQAQDALYAAHLDKIPDRDKLAARLAELLKAGEVGTPAWRGDRHFWTRREPGQEHAVLYTASAADSERALIDPMTVDPSGATTLDQWQPDHSGRLLAYQLSEGGSEESVLRVLDTGTGEVVDGPIDRCRYTDVAWLPDGSGFYYTRRLAPEIVPPGEEQFHRRVYLHRLGKPCGEDVLIFGDGLEKTNYYGLLVSRDGRWLIITASAGTAPRNDAWVAELAGRDPAAPQLRVLQQGVDAQTWPVPGRDGRLYLLTDSGAPRRKLAVTDPADPQFPGPGSWRDLLAEDAEAVLEDFAILDGAELSRPLLLAARQRHAISEITVHELASGLQVAEIELPGLGSVGALRERPEGGHEAWFGYTDYTTPGLVLRYDATAGGTEVWQQAPGVVDVPPVQARQVNYASADGTTIRMVILSAADGHGAPGTAGAGSDHVPDKRPAILYGYGGFNVSLTPSFSPSALAWAEAGGVYAIAGLRGGSEEGEEWHRSGMRERKQNVFDDFHAAAEKLIADGWTSSGQLAVWGGSNGGLLVGASITQRPDLSAAAVCSAPLLDMVRYEQFGLGVTWNDEFGSAAVAAELGWLLSYSPYHHVRAGVRYPAVLFTVFDGDTRVDPLHGRKMCAALQYATAAPPCERPVLLRREAQVGHGARAVSRTIALTAEQLAFAAAQTGLTVS